MCNLGFDLEYEHFSKSIASGRYVFLFDALYSQHDATKSGYKRRMKTQLASDDFKSIVAAVSISSYLDRVFSMASDQLLSYLSLRAIKWI
ncbi:hypothetical protein [Cohnella soli]|uniref:Uncharacterized protein n=1 Tax=Cohnella soli TaxID=425005 RepID=A0ABW0HLS0_9BACL